MRVASGMSNRVASKGDLLPPIERNRSANNVAQSVDKISVQ
jgi:hypothetical protein